MQIANFIQQPKETGMCINEAINFFFNKDVLVLNDTRLLIIPSVLPHIPFVGSYDQRIMPILSNTTFIASDPLYPEIFKYLRTTMGLVNDVEILSIENNPNIPLTENILSNNSLIQELKEKKFKKVINCFVDERVEELACAIGAVTDIDSSISRLANDKAKLKQFLEKNHLPTIQGTYASTPEVIKEYFDKEQEYFFKSPQGVSGYGFWSNKKNTLEEILQGSGQNEIIIEQVIVKESSPSIQFCIYGEKNERRACIFGFTDQILEGGQYYLGNQSPSRYHGNTLIEKEIIRQSEAIIEYLREMEYVGFGWIDFIVTPEHNIYATEVNARFTGATYPAVTSFLLTKSLVTPWKYVTKEWETNSIEDYLKISIKTPEEYGLFPLCIAPLNKWGRAQVMYIGNMDEHDI